MTDEELADIKSRYAALSAIVAARGQSFRTAGGHMDMMTPVEGAAFFAQMIVVCAEDMPALLAEVEQWRAIGRTVADGESLGEDGGGDTYCVYCDGDGYQRDAQGNIIGTTSPDYDRSFVFGHSADCPVTKARALLSR